MVNKYKQLQLVEVKNKLQTANNIVFIDFSNCNSNNMTNFRMELKKNKLGVFVLKNSLAVLAFRELNVPAALIEKLNGQNAIVYGDDPIVIAKCLKNFLEKKSVIKIKSVFFEGKIYDKNIVDQYSRYNSKNDLIAMLIREVKLPVMLLIFNLKYVVNKFIVVLKEVANKSSK